MNGHSAGGTLGFFGRLFGRRDANWHEPLLKDVLVKFIRNVPPTWNAAVLTLKAPAHGLGTGVSHSIISPEGRRDVASPSGELMLATREFELGSVEHKLDWKKVVVTVERAGESWKSNIDFDYGDAAAE
jgi:hypothetical protein